jgi:DNA replication protein DnaC
VAWVQDIIRGSVPGPGGLRCQIQPGGSLLLVGITGSGKSHQLWGALRALAVSGCTGTLVTAKAADLYAQMRPRPGVDSETVFAGYAKAAVLLLDDLGAAKGSDWVEEINSRLVDYRYEHGLRTMITSNVPAEGDQARGVRGFREQFGDRVTSRLREMCSRVVLDGPDRRSAGAR